MNTLLLLRSVSGAGKTSFAQNLVTMLYPGKVCFVEADSFFYDENGNYQFKAEKLGVAHKNCLTKCENALQNNFPMIIVSNTSTREEDVKRYQDLALKYNYRFVSAIIENRHGNQNIHNVPLQVLVRQEAQLKASLKLLP